MDGSTGGRRWLPELVTGLVFVILVGGTALAVSPMFADLVGLMYLLASPFVYRGIRTVFAWGAAPARAGTASTG